VGSVTIERERGFWRDLLRAYTVEIDGRDVGSLKRGETATFELASGDGHAVRLTIDWCSSRLLVVSGDEHTRLVCSPASRAWTAIFDVTFRTAEYIRLERA
jgi:hypothetical protein